MNNLLFVGTWLNIVMNNANFFYDVFYNLRQIFCCSLIWNMPTDQAGQPSIQNV